MSRTMKSYTPKDGTPLMKAIQEALTLADEEQEPVALVIDDRHITVEPGEDELDVWHRAHHGDG